MHFRRLLIGLLTFDGDATVESLQSGLYTGTPFKKSTLMEYATQESQSLPSEDRGDNQTMDMEEMDLVSRRRTTCWNHAVCCYFLLQQLTLFTTKNTWPTNF